MHMDAQMVEQAVFMVRDAHVSRQDAVHALEDYFPGAAFEDRVRCVYEAQDIVRCGEPVAYAVPSQLSDARYFAAAHERHGFTD
jgi:hypothetical protein